VILNKKQQPIHLELSKDHYYKEDELSHDKGKRLK
jgi:hypothetical protein